VEHKAGNMSGLVTRQAGHAFKLMLTKVSQLQTIRARSSTAVGSPRLAAVRAGIATIIVFLVVVQVSQPFAPTRKGYIPREESGCYPILYLNE
jgi:hypothetical protein